MPATTLPFAVVEPLETRRHLSAVLPAARFIVTPVQLPPVRGALRPVAVVGDTLLVGGSWGYFTAPYEIDVYDVTTGRATQSLLDHRPGWDHATIGRRVLFAGGPAPADAAHVYDADTGEWSTAQLSQARTQLGAATVADKVIFAGGLSDHAQHAYDDVDIYDAATGRWTTARLSYPRGDVAAAVVGNKAIFAGGRHGDVLQDAAHRAMADIYDAGTGAWTAVPLPQRNAWFRTALTAGRYALFATADPSLTGAPETLVDVYGSTTGRWTVHAFAEPRAAYGAAVAGDLAFFAGGRYVEDLPDGSWADRQSRTVDVFDARTGRWSTLHLPPATGASGAVGGKVFFPGVSTSMDDPGFVDIYDPATGRWSSTTIPDASTDTAVNVGGRAVLVTGSASGHLALLTPTTLPPPARPSLPHKAAVAAAPPRASWSPVPGARGYDVYLDGVLDKRVSSAAWAPRAAIAPGPHTWQVFARVGGGTLAGPPWRFSIRPPRVTAEVGPLRLPRLLTHGATGTVALTLRNAGSALPAPFEVLAYASPAATPTAPDDDVLVGRLRSDAPLAHGAWSRLTVPLAVPPDMPAGSYSLVVTLAQPGAAPRAPLAIAPAAFYAGPTTFAANPLIPARSLGHTDGDSDVLSRLLPPRGTRP